MTHTPTLIEVFCAFSKMGEVSPLSPLHRRKRPDDEINYDVFFQTYLRPQCGNEWPIEDYITFYNCLTHLTGGTPMPYLHEAEEETEE